ncbi:class I SAM-dependent methyltransferase [Methanobacterium sp.]|uniref:class I SAM-dependent methyltransferase n=1 Tax=Methanobacterium sp. TaxID=2164 RepID=UPI002AB9E12B|nr:class I SAM-dependent methyltransferase [Methanobacterium sp.]MDY9924288.1 class I SAM-dependent methyltransferase [Methanobacterium sp.]
MNKKKHSCCDLCGSRNHKLVFTNKDRMFPEIEGKFKLYQCKSCGLLFLEQPCPHVLKKHYSAGYSVFSDSSETKDARKIFTLIEMLYHYVQERKDVSGFSRVLKFLFTPFSPFFRTAKIIDEGRYLDVGCGIGYFPLTMKYLGMEPNGVEPASFDPELSNRYNLNIFNGTLDQANYEDEYFDVITLNHVLEHVTSPSETMGELNRILKPGGYLIIAVPVNDSLASKIFGKYWAQMDTPRHLYLFSTEILEKYARKYNFSILDVRYNSDPRYQIISSFIYFLENFFNKKFNRAFIHNIYLNLLLIPFTSILNLFKLGDQCEIVLKKN